MRNCRVWDRGWCLCIGPQHPGEVSLVQPRLVNVEDSSPLSQQRNHLHRILLSQHQTSRAVGLRRNLLGHPVPQAQVILHNGPHLPNTDLYVLFFFDLLHHHLCILDGCLSLKHLVHDPRDCILFLFLLFLLLSQLSVLLAIFLGLPYQLAHQLGRDLEVLGDVALEDVIVQVHLHDCIPGGGRELLPVALLVLGSDACLGSCTVPDLQLQKMLWVVFSL